MRLGRGESRAPFFWGNFNDRSLHRRGLALRLTRLCVVHFHSRNRVAQATPLIYHPTAFGSWGFFVPEIGTRQLTLAQ
jgi:hypothetical protein